MADENSADPEKMGGTTMQLKALFALVLMLGLPRGVSAQEPAGASAYLAGVFDWRNDRVTILQIVNPTAATLRLFTALFDINGNAVLCIANRIEGNGLIEEGIT